MDFVSIVTTMCPEAKWTQTPQEDLKKAKTLKKVLGAALNSPRKKKIIREDLQIGPPLDKISGDGHKNGINYEMKTLIYYKNKPFNFISNPPRSFWWLLHILLRVTLAKLTF